MLSEILISPILRNSHSEWDQVDATAHSFVNGTQTRFMIAGDDQFELRNELEKILPHEPGCDPVATCKRLDPAFSPTPSFFGFDRRDHASPTKAGEVCGVTISHTRDEGFDRRSAVVLT